MNSQQQQIDNRTRNRYSRVKILTYDRLSYLIQFSEEKLIFFSSELLEQIQTVRQFHGEILTVATSSSQGLVFVFCKEEFSILQPFYDSNNFSIKWEKVYNQRVKEAIKDGYSSFDDQYLITCSDHSIKIWNVLFDIQNNVNTVSKIQPIFNLNVREDIKNVKFSPDSRYFTTMSEVSSIIFVWDFIKILDNHTGYLDEGQQTPSDNITNYVLKHENDIKTYKFRDSIKSPQQPYGPNTIVSIDVQGILKVWQESPEDEAMFFHIHTVQLENINNISSLSFSFVYFSSNYAKKDLGYLYQSISNQTSSYGLYEKDDFTSLDWIIVLKDTSMDLYCISHLRNISKTSKIERFSSLNNPRLLKYIRFLLYAQEKKRKDSEYIHFYGLDYLGNLVKVQQNINQPNDIKTYITNKRLYGKIQNFSYDDNSDSIITLDSNQNLCYQASPYQQIFPQRFDFLSEDSNWQWQFNSKIQVIKLVEHYKNNVFIFDDKLKVLEIIQLVHQENKLLQQQLDIEDQAKDIVGLAYQKSQFEYQIKTLSKYQNENTEILLEFLIYPLNTNKLIAVRLKLSQEAFNDKKSFQLEVMYRYEIPETFQKFKLYNYNSREVSFKLLTREEKQICLYEVKGPEIKKIQNISRKPDTKRVDFIKYSGWVNSKPQLFYIITFNNEIEFYNEDKEILTKFSLKNLLYGVDTKLYDISQVSILVKHFYDNNFILAVENYLMLFNLQFDKRKQSYVINLVKQNQKSNDLYYKRFSRFTQPSNYEIIVTKDLKMIIKTNETIMRFNGFFNEQVIDINQLDTSQDQHALLPENFYRKIVSSLKILPHHHPEFIYELLTIGNFEVAQIILYKCLLSLIKNRYVSSKFSFSITKLYHLFLQKKTGTLRIKNEFEDVDLPNQSLVSKLSIIGNTLSEDIFEQKDYATNRSDQFLYDILKVLQEEKDVFRLEGNQSAFLETLVKFLIDLKEKYDFDIFGKLFMFHVSIFNNQKFISGAQYKPRSLFTKEIVWACHSEAKDFISNELFGKYLENRSLKWDILRRYCYPLWQTDTLQITKYLNEIATITFFNREQALKDSAQVDNQGEINLNNASLWYVLGGQLNVLINKLDELFQTTSDPIRRRALGQRDLLQKAKEYIHTKVDLDLMGLQEKEDFLSEQQKIKQKLENNAFELQKRGQYEKCAAFYLIAGKIEDAVNIMIEKLEDIQLAILTLKLFETGEKNILKQVVQQHFIDVGKQMNDVFLQNIGYYILGKYVQSVNALYELDYEEGQKTEFAEAGKKTCMDWKAKFEPDLSSFHPSAILLAEMLKNSHKVKYQLQECSASQKQYYKQMEDCSIFDDFLGSPQNSSSSIDEKQEEEESLDLKLNLPLHLKLSLQFYNLIKLPLLGLVFYKTNQEETQMDQSVKNCIQKLVSSHIDFLIERSLSDKDQDNYFMKLRKNISELADYFKINTLDPYLQQKFDEKTLIHMADKKIQKMKSLSHSVSMKIALGEIENAIGLLLKFCTQSQHLFYSLTFDNNLKLKQQHFWMNCIYITEQLKKTIVYIQQSKYMSEQNIMIEINSFKLYKLFCYFILNLGLEQFLEVNEILKEVSDFSEKSILKQQSFEMKYNFKINQLIEKANQTRDLKFKNAKATRYQDMFAEAFPTSPYQFLDDKKEQISSKQNLSNDEQENIQNNKYKMILFSMIRYMSIKNLEIILSKNFKGYEKMDCQLDKFNYINIIKQVEFYAKNQKKIFKALMKHFSASDQNRILDQILGIFEDSSYYQHASYYKNLPSYANPDDIYQFKQNLKQFDKFDNLFHHLKAKILVQQYRHPNYQWSQLQEKEKQELFKSGIEVIKIKQEQLRGFCINNYQNTNREIICMTNKTFRKVDLIEQIVNKSRFQDGLSLCEEETFSIDPAAEDRRTIQKVSNQQLDQKPLVIKLAAKLLNSRQIRRDLLNQEVKLNKFRYTYFDQYTEQEVADLIKYGNIKNINEIDSLCIVSHPNLPIFFTGGRGIVEIWSCNKFTKINDFNYQSKDPIVTLKISKFGEKIGGIDQSGSLYLWKFHKNTKLFSPFFAALSNKQRQINDFCFINHGSMIAAITNYQLLIFDTLMPLNQSQSEIRNIPGNFLNYSSNKNIILITNSKKCLISIYDTKKNDIRRYIENKDQSVGQEYRCTFLNRRENVFVVGTNDGFIKIFELETFSLVISYQVFKQIDKRPPVSVTQILQINDSLFASSSDGVIQMVHPAIL
ncbi:hypothetical protein ABPG74_015732 [Tetrahymena malaccensis]